MAAALQQVKRELGTSAVILHTRTFKRGGVMGWGAKQVVEITASDDVNVATRAPRPAARSAPQPRSAPSRSATASAGGNLLTQTYRAAEAAARYEPTAAAPAPSDAAVAPSASPGATATVEKPATAPASAPGGDPELTQEIKQIRAMVDRMMRKQARQQPPELPETLFSQYLTLLEQEVAEELAEQVVQNVREELSGERIDDSDAVREAVTRQIAQLIPTDAAATEGEPGKDGRPRTIALVGPTGVGKTTTIAKLAATLKLKQKKKVAMLTIDTYRIAAVDQLQTYAEIIKVPLHVVPSPEDVDDALARCADCDVVLIDTAGRSQRDGGKLEQLQRFLGAAKPHEVHLVLSSTCSQRVLMEAVERFQPLGVDRVIFTKLDEAVNFGVLLNVVRQIDKQLSYVTTGQEVPHQIEPGSSARLAELILGEQV